MLKLLGGTREGVGQKTSQVMRWLLLHRSFWYMRIWWSATTWGIGAGAKRKFISASMPDAVFLMSVSPCWHRSSICIGIGIWQRGRGYRLMRMKWWLIEMRCTTWTLLLLWGYFMIKSRLCICVQCIRARRVRSSMRRRLGIVQSEVQKWKTSESLKLARIHMLHKISTKHHAIWHRHTRGSWDTPTSTLNVPNSLGRLFTSTSSSDMHPLRFISPRSSVAPKTPHPRLKQPILTPIVLNPLSPGNIGATKSQGQFPKSSLRNLVRLRRKCVTVA